MWQLLELGTQIKRDAAQSLIKLVTWNDVDMALVGIDDSNAHDIDGFNSHFFKKWWHIIKDAIFMAVKEFFYTSIIPHEINYTSVTLITKIVNPSSIKEYRPIACCTVLYKIIAKNFTMMLQGVMGDVV